MSQVYKSSLLAKPYPSADEWRKLVKEFDAQAIAHKLLLSHIPFVFEKEPLKYALFRKEVAKAFNVEPTSVFIVGSAMAGRSLKGPDIKKEYSPASDIDALIVSESLFTSYVMRSLEWIKDVTKPDRKNKNKNEYPTLSADTVMQVNRVAMHACKGIWRPDSLPKIAPVRQAFFEKMSNVSLSTLGLQLSDDTVAHVTGRIARSFDCAVDNLAGSIFQLAKEFDGEKPEEGSPDSLLDPESRT